MNIGQIEERIQDLAQSLSRDTFIYDLLAAYGLPKASITRLQHGSYNLSKIQGEIIWKKKLYFRAIFDEDLHGFIDTRRKEEAITKHAPRFLIVTDFETFLAYDSKTQDTLDISLTDLPRHFDFFLPWAGMEKAQGKLENPADVKAAVKMAKLYDLIKHDNPDRYTDAESLHELNVFLSRLLFCYFAESTEIFSHKLFTNSIISHTHADAADLDIYLNRLFEVLNAPEPLTPSLHNLGTMFEPLNKDAREGFPEYLTKFPYVNGGLFAQTLRSPKFSARTRKMLIECGRDLNWSDINPDIFGSMMQAVVHPDERGNMGMHYTSVTNIMKVIEPLFLNGLYEEFDKFRDDERNLRRLLERLRTVHVFDPACGSGNFLIIAYKELRKLEMRIFEQLQEISTQKILAMPGITLSQFYGIELDDFAHEIAILSLWLAEHQMNVAFKKVFGRTRPSLPLTESGKIVCGNATRLDWREVCPIQDDVEIFVLGNPPYLGSRHQTAPHKADIVVACGGLPQFKKLDYIACWFVKGASFIRGTANRLAFVSTNSVCQGEQVALLWPYIFDDGLEISFAHQAFKWSNNAKSNAGVTCVVIGLAVPKGRQKELYYGGLSHKVSNINAYLTAGSNIIVSRRGRAISQLPRMDSGNKATDGGHLFLTPAERNRLINQHPESSGLVRRVYGAEEFINGIERWCLWISDDDLPLARSIPFVVQRIERVRQSRLESRDVGANQLAERSHQFREMKEADHLSIFVPTVSSERREYIPIGYLSKRDVIIAPNNAIYDPEAHIFGLVTSKMHVVWAKATSGSLESRIRYSSVLSYNTFPLPRLSELQRKSIAAAVFNLIEEREKHPDKVMAELYDPDTMPQELRGAHRDLDAIVERCYRPKQFNSDEERLEFLFRLYEQMTSQDTEAAVA